MHFRAITLSGEVGSGKSSIAAALLEGLPGWKRINTGQRFRDFCSAQGMLIEQVSFVPDEVHAEFDQQQGELLAAGQNIIVEGRLAGWLARDLPDVFRVYCQAPVEVRIERSRQREKVPAEQAAQDVDTRDRLDLEKYRRIYQLQDYRDPRYYHLVLDTCQAAPPELARRVLEQAGLQQPG
jgi:CMP/dCMP kinase